MSAYRSLSVIDSIIIHCADTPNGKVFTADDIDDWHGPGRKKQGLNPFKRSMHARAGTGKWNGEGEHAKGRAHLGYHFVIRLNGTVEIGRRLTETGAHAKGWNRRSIGIVMIGRDKFTNMQWAKLKTLISNINHERASKKLPKLEIIKGHRDVASYKTCPGFEVSAWVAGSMQPLQEHIIEEES